MDGQRQRRAGWIPSLFLLLGVLFSGPAHAVLHGEAEGWSDEDVLAESHEDGEGCSACCFDGDPGAGCPTTDSVLQVARAHSLPPFGIGPVRPRRGMGPPRAPPETTIR